MQGSKTLMIKNMVCPRCILAVETVLRDHGISFSIVQLGEVELSGDLSPDNRQRLAQSLARLGFELLDDQRRQQIERIKTLIIQKVQGGDVEEHFSLSRYLGEHIFRDYSSLSRLFSEVEGMTIEQFFIIQRIEKAKEWLVYNELPASDIAVRLGFSSPQHLSTQFKKLTGMTPSQFKKLGSNHRQSLDSLGGKGNKV
jgi:AraC-like DNA-binding protein